MTQGGGRGVAPLILNFSNRLRSVVNAMLRSPYLQENKLTFFERGAGWATASPDMSALLTEIRSHVPPQSSPVA